MRLHSSINGSATDNDKSFFAYLFQKESFFFGMVNLNAAPSTIPISGFRCQRVIPNTDISREPRTGIDATMVLPITNVVLK
jgi:hypothetical protein